MQEVIFNIIEKEFGFCKQDLLSKLKYKKLADIRGILFYMLHYDLGLSSLTIAKMCNRKVRSIKKSNATFKFLINNQEEYKILYNKLKNKFSNK